MADHRKPAGTDDTPAIFDQMDALMARHRGSGPDQSIPVLREIAVPPGQRNTRGGSDAIPVLTEVESMIGDDFMFSPEEIHPPEHEPVYEPPPAASRAHEASPARSVAPVEPEHIPMLDAPLLPEAPRRAAPVAPPPPAPEPAPAPKASSFDTGFDFPLLELDEPAAKPVAPVRQAPPPAPVQQAAAPRPTVVAPVPPPPAPAQDEAFMPELTLNFDFSPPEENAKAPATPIVTSMANSAARSAEAAQAEAASRLAASSGYMSAPTVGLSIELPADEEPAPVPPPAMISMESQTVGLRIEVPHAQSGNPPSAERRSSAVTSSPFAAASPVVANEPAQPAAPPPPAVDPAVLANELMVLLKPHLEKMVRVEMSRQIASIHSAAIKNVLSVLQPKLGPLVAQAVRQVLSKRS